MVNYPAAKEPLCFLAREDYKTNQKVTKRFTLTIPESIKQLNTTLCHPDFI